MTNIIVVGASDVFDLTAAAYEAAEGRVIGYCGLAPIHSSRYADFPWLGDHPLRAMADHPDAAFVIALSNNARRRVISEEVRAAGGTVLSVIHPQTAIYPTAALGSGIIVQPFSTVSTHAVVGDGAYLNYGCLVGHDVRVGSYSFISPGARLLGEVAIGAEVFIGSNAVIFPRVTIGDHARISAGAVVTAAEVPPGVTVMARQQHRTLTVAP